MIQHERTLVLTTTVELERSKEGNALTRRAGTPEGQLGSIEAIHVRLMMLGMVKSHDLFVDIRLQGVICVGEGRELVL